MAEEELRKQVSRLMGGKKAYRQTEIVKIKTKEHTRRGLLRGVQPDGVLVFSWIPELAENVKSIENLSMDVITVICSYKPEQVLSIK